MCVDIITSVLIRSARGDAMNVIVRLYWQHDLDLVALTLHPMFEMGKWMKKAMIAYAQGG